MCLSMVKSAYCNRLCRDNVRFYQMNPTSVFYAMKFNMTGKLTCSDYC